MRSDEIEGLTGEFKPDLIHEIRCPIGLERPGGDGKMLQQPSLELQLFVGFDELSYTFRDPPFNFVFNQLALIQPLSPAFNVLAVDGTSHRSVKFGLRVCNPQVEFRRHGLLGKADQT